MLRIQLVETTAHGKVWCSRGTCDLRLILVFSKSKKTVIVSIKLGGHDDVYN